MLKKHIGAIVAAALILLCVVFLLYSRETPEKAACAFLTMAYTVDADTSSDPLKALARFEPFMTTQGAEILARNRNQSIGLVRGWQSAEVTEITLTPIKGNEQVWTYEVWCRVLKSGEAHDGKDTGFIAVERQNGKWLIGNLTMNSAIYRDGQE